MAYSEKRFVTPEIRGLAETKYAEKPLTYATGNWLLDQIGASLQGAVTALFTHITGIKNKIEKGDFTGAILGILEIAIPAFLLFVAIDLLTTKVLGVGFDLTGVKEFLQKIFKVDLFVSAIMGAWIGAGLKSPAEQVCNKLFRPSIMSQSVATQQYIKGKISKAMWQDVLARWGIPDGHMTHVLDVSDKKPSILEAGRMYQLLQMPDSALRWLLKENLVLEEPLIEWYLKYFKAMRLRDEFAAYVSYLKRAYLDGLETDTTLKTELGIYKTSTEERDQIIANLVKEFSRILTRSEMETRIWHYRKGLYGEEPPPDDPESLLYADLIALGVNSAMCNAIVRLEAAKKGIPWEKQ